MTNISIKSCLSVDYHILQIIRGNNTLIIFNSNPRDSGTYICEADNGYSSGISL